MLPSLFLSHGSPTLPFDDCPARDFLRGLGETIGRPEAILIASGHWESTAPLLNSVAVNDTIHDFYNFPEALYRQRYPAPGAPQLAARVAMLLGENGHDAGIDSARGLDHGAWIPLLLMYPEAEIPVVQLSIQSWRGAGHHIALGRALRPLREENVLVIGSGGFTHNLRQLDRIDPDAGEAAWSRDFSDWMHAALMAADDAALADYRQRAPHAAIAHPTEDHIVPLHVAYGAGGKAERLHSSATMGSLRMDAYAFA